MPAASTLLEHPGYPVTFSSVVALNNWGWAPNTHPRHVVPRLWLGLAATRAGSTHVGSGKGDAHPRLYALMLVTRRRWCFSRRRELCGHQRSSMKTDE
jgi:hypothetical protein